MERGPKPPRSAENQGRQLISRPARTTRAALPPIIPFQRNRQRFRFFLSAMSTDAVRLNKFLASCGIGSRRHCDALVQDGQVTVNGEPCTKPATRIGPDDAVRLNRKLVEPKLTTTLLFHKPRGNWPEP